MVKVYIAGPYRASSTWGVHCNIHNAKQWGLEIAQLGANPFIPHANTGYYDGTLPEQFWLDADIEWLVLCDALFVLPGSDHSAGTQEEIRIAEQAGIPVFHTLVGLDAFIQEEYP